MDIQYIGENLLPRTIGHIGIILSFVAAFLTAISYYFSTKNRENIPLYESWRSIGRWSFAVHGFAVITIIGMLFYVMINKRYEYFYAHSHTDDSLEFRYLFAAFWEGQEGSFLLWMFWHVGLGAWIILRGGTYQQYLGIARNCDLSHCSSIFSVNDTRLAFWMG